MIKYEKLRSGGESRHSGNWVLSCKRSESRMGCLMPLQAELDEKEGEQRRKGWTVYWLSESWPAWLEGLWFWLWSLGLVVCEQA